MNRKTNSIKNQIQKRLSKRIYGSRIVVYIFGSIAISVSFYYHSQSILAWVSVLTFCFVWPHVAYYVAIRTINSVKAERRNLAIDSFVGGMTLPLMSFSIIPSIAILGVHNLSIFSIGGVKLFLKSAFFFILGILILFPFTSRDLSFEATPAITLACVPLLIIYPMIVAFKTYHVIITANKDKVNIEFQNIKLEKAYKEIKRQHNILENFAHLDGLTGISNRRRFDEYLGCQWENAQRSRTPLSAIMIDIDDFKEYNDFYGHGYGDECLKKVAQILSKTIKRPNDMLARYGGDEFVCLLPATDLDGAVNLAEEMNKSVMSLSIPHKKSSVTDCVTVSIGVSFIQPTKGSSSSILLENADNALYDAKNDTRNCVRILNCYEKARLNVVAEVA